MAAYSPVSPSPISASILAGQDAQPLYTSTPTPIAAYCYSPTSGTEELSPCGIEISFELELELELDSVQNDEGESSASMSSRYSSQTATETDFDIDISGAISPDSSYPSTAPSHSSPPSVLSPRSQRSSLVETYTPIFPRSAYLELGIDAEPHFTPRVGNIGKRTSAPGIMQSARAAGSSRRSSSVGENSLGQRRRSGIEIPYRVTTGGCDVEGGGGRRASMDDAGCGSESCVPHTHILDHGREPERRLFSGPNSPSFSSPKLHQTNHTAKSRSAGDGEATGSQGMLGNGNGNENDTSSSVHSSTSHSLGNVPDSDGVSGSTLVDCEPLFIYPDISPTEPTFDIHPSIYDTPPITTPTRRPVRSTPSPVESDLSLLTTPSDRVPFPKGGSLSSFPTPPPREPSTNLPSPSSSLLSSLPIHISFLSPDLVDKKEPMSLNDHGHWVSSSPHDQYAQPPPAFTRQKAPSHPSSSRTTSTLPGDIPPSSSAFSNGGGSRRLSKFTAFSGSSSGASSLYSSDNDSIRDRERQYRVTEHPDISTVFEEGSSFEVDYEREAPPQPHHRPSQSRLVNNASPQRTQRAGTLSSTHSTRTNKAVHPFAAVIHRAPSPPSAINNMMSDIRPTSPYHASTRSHTSMSEAVRTHHKPAHQVTLAEEGSADDEEKCPICVESLGFTYRLPGEKPHVVPECGHALHEECFVTVYGEVPTHGSKRNIGLCGVCRQKMRIVDGGGERKRSKGKKLDMLMGASSMTPPLRSIPSYPSLTSIQSPTVSADPNGDDPVESASTSTSSKSFSIEHKVVVPTITIRSEFPSTTRQQGKPITAMITIEVPPAGDREYYPASRPMDLLRSPSITGNLTSPGFPSSPGSFHSHDTRPTSLSPSIPVISPFASVEAELKHRVVDYKNSGLDSLGPLRLYDMIAIRKGSMLREFLMYLYNDALICISEEKPNAFQKIFSSGSSMRSNDTKSSAGTGSGRGPLKLRGRIYVKHVKKLVDTSVPSELSITILMENEGMESFILTFKDKASHETWKSTLQQIVDDAKNPSASAKGGNSANKIAKLMGSGAPPPIPRTGSSATTPGLPSSSSMGFAPSMSDFGLPPTPNSFTHGRGPSAGDLVNIAPLAPSHTPLDLVIVLSIPPTQPGSGPPLKLRLMRQSLAFVFALLGSKDRVSIISCEVGTSIRRTPLLNPTKYESRLRLEEFVEGIGAGPIPDDEYEIVTQPNERHDVVTAMNVSLDVILQRKAKNPLTGLILISDTADVTKRAQMDLVCARLDAANTPVHSLGYGKAHDPTPLWMVSNHTQGTYTFVREWYHLRDSLAGVIGGLMTVALTNMKLHLSAQENEFRIVKVTGTPQAIGSATGKTLDIELKELRFGEKREILVEVELVGDGSSDRNSGDSGSRDGRRPGPASSFRKSPTSLIGGMDNMSVADSNSVMRDLVYEEGMVDEVPVIEVDCSFHDPALGRSVSRLAHPILLTLAILPSASLSAPSTSDPTVQRRKMELIASDMLTRSLLLVTRRNFVQAHKLLSETRRIVRTIADGIRANLPAGGQGRTKKEVASVSAVEQLDNIVGDMDALCEALDENPELFGKDQRNFASQQGIVLRSQRSWTMRTGTESYYCTDDVRKVVQISGDWGIKG